MANNRIYYAIQQVSFGKNSSGSTGVKTAAHGVQSCGITTTFNLEQVFELGQLAIYENVEGTPDIEVTMSKVADGYIPLYCLATSDQTNGPQLAKRCDSNTKTTVQLGIWDEAVESAGQSSSNAQTWVEMSGLYLSSVSYNFPVDDNFSEDLTLVGNTKIWGSGQSTSSASCNASYFPTGIAGAFGGNNDAPKGSGGVNRRQNMVFATGTAATAAGNYASKVQLVAQVTNPDNTILPEDIPGVTTSGAKDFAHVQSITASVDVAREELFELGAKIAYARPVTFPIEVTCDIEITASSGDLVNAIDSCSGSANSCEEAANLTDRTIRVATCEGLRLFLGNKNKLSSVTYGGGDAGGGNATVSYSYSTFNDFTVMHWADMITSGGSQSGAKWWELRSSYLETR
jgi:hypothetical protein|tara:strand:- start:4019 stop:5221 length:1203 start_codon:yes stop_codon:yes gene_type:complete